MYRALATSVVLVGGILYTGDLLQARGPVLQFAVACAVYSFSAIASKRNSTFSVVSSVVFGLIVLFGTVWLFITPASAYSAWFLLIDRGAAQGSVSFVMLLVGWIGVAYLAVVFSRQPLLLLSSLVAWSFFIVAVATRSYTALSVSLAALIVSLVSSARLPLKGSAVHGLMLVLLFAIAILGGFVSVLYEAPRGSTLIDNRVSPALRTLVLRIRPDFPLLAGFSGNGTGFAEATLSGTPLLSESPVLEISPGADRTEYVRSRIFDTYSAGSWTNRRSGANEFNLLESGVWAPTWMEPRRVDHGQMERRSIRILADYLDVLPYPVGFPFLMIPPSHDDFQGGDTPERMRPIFTANDEYTVIAFDNTVDLDGLDNRTESMYTAVPEKLEDSLSVFVRKDLSDPTAVQNHIRRILSEDSTYSLVQLRPPDGTDPLEYFLHGNRSGFCIHFASAAVMLARLHGLPARYVTGFLAPSSRHGAPVVVEGVHAHAWAEVRVDGEWRVLETTPGPGSIADPGVALPAETSPDPLTRRQLSAFGLSDRATDEGRPLVWVPPSVSVAVVVMVALGAGLYGLTKRSGNERFGLTGKSPMCVYPVCALRTRNARHARRELRRIVRGSGDSHPSKTGWSGWAKSMSERGPAQRTAARRYETVASIAQNLFFGSREIRTRDLTYLRRVRRRKPT